MRSAYCLAGIGNSQVRTLKVGATVIAGQPVIPDGSSFYGTITDCTTTGASKALGVTLGAATYSTSTEGTVEVEINPMMVYKAKVTGGAASDTALNTTSPAQLLTQATASTTVISDTNRGTIEYAGGMICAYTGANAGVIRTITSHSDNASDTVTVAFPSTVAVGDKLMRVGAGPGTYAMTLSTELDQVRGDIAVNTGANLSVVDVQFVYDNVSYPEIYVYVVLRDHAYNALA